MRDDYFADGGGYRFDMKDVLLGGPITEFWDYDRKRWQVAQEVGGRRWEGAGESSIAAVLDLIEQRMEAFPPHRARRGSDVETWIKRHRDGHNPDGTYGTGERWQAIEDMLNDYRDHADFGVSLTDEVHDHPNGGDDAAP